MKNQINIFSRIGILFSLFIPIVFWYFIKLNSHGVIVLTLLQKNSTFDYFILLLLICGMLIAPVLLIIGLFHEKNFYSNVMLLLPFIISILVNLIGILSLSVFYCYFRLRLFSYIAVYFAIYVIIFLLFKYINRRQ